MSANRNTFLEEVAARTVIETRKKFRLGSGNLSHNYYSVNERINRRRHSNELPEYLQQTRSSRALVDDQPSRYTRSYFPEVYEYRQQTRDLDALIDEPIEILARRKIRRHRDECKRIEKESRLAQTQNGFISYLNRPLPLRKIELAEKSMAGNCGEMAKSAYLFISRTWPVRSTVINPQIVSLYRASAFARNTHNQNTRGFSELDHVCVTITIGNEREQAETITDIQSLLDHTRQYISGGNTHFASVKHEEYQDWRTWNPETIIIDPWICRWFYVGLLRKENPWPYYVPTQDIRFKCRTLFKS